MGTANKVKRDRAGGSQLIVTKDDRTSNLLTCLKANARARFTMPPLSAYEEWWNDRIRRRGKEPSRREAPACVYHRLVLLVRQEGLNVAVAGRRLNVNGAALLARLPQELK